MNLTVRSGFATLSAVTVLVGFAPTRAQESGVIEFHDEAPPPTEQEKQDAASAHNRAAILAEQITRLTTAMLATQRLSAALASDPASTDLSAAIDPAKWQSAGDALVVESGDQPTWTFKPDAVAPYVAAAIALQTAIAGSPRSLRPDGVADKVTALADKLSLTLDDLVAEHGLLNTRLRYHPFSSIAKQEPLDCALVNKYSRDFRCLSKSKLDAPDTGDWLYNKTYARADWCEASDVQNYKVDFWPDTVTLVRKASFSDHIVTRANAEATIAAPHAQSAIKPKC